VKILQKAANIRCKIEFNFIAAQRDEVYTYEQFFKLAA
jgi:hypothetical protein